MYTFSENELKHVNEYVPGSFLHPSIFKTPPFMGITDEWASIWEAWDPFIIRTSLLSADAASSIVVRRYERNWVG